MATSAAVIGLSAGKGLLSSSFYYSDITEKLSSGNEPAFSHHQASSARNLITARKSSNYSSSFIPKRKELSVKAVKEHLDTAEDLEIWLQTPNQLERDSDDIEFHVDALLLLQKSMLEKQFKLSSENKTKLVSPRDTANKMHITASGTSARRRRVDNRRKILSHKGSIREVNPSAPLNDSTTPPDFLHSHLKGYVKGVLSQELLTHSEVVQLSRKIKTGLHLEEQRARLKERLGCEPSEDQLASSVGITRTELQSKLLECSLAREKLAMSNVRLVMSIAQIYDNMGAEMSDLIQGGLIGLLRGIEKFDCSKGFKISTYVYWWIRQGVSKAVVENSRTLRLPTHLHERLSMIRNAKIKLEERGITPSVDKIAECLNMSQRKVRNATEAVSKVFSLDREAFPSLNGLPGATLHSYIADTHLENNPWHGVDGWSLKHEVNNLINSTLVARERDIIRLYYGLLDNECLTWEDISRRIGLSRERVRQVGLVALEKLKHAARKKRLEAMLVKH
ncbi:hypothetical protein Leryth_004626 [Lithospermum erythrorhizon]|nr:hypothetical protein Leryth_004626 [Lithospermum erythrorhizon]